MTLLARAYKTRTPILLVDDAKVGIDPQSLSLLAMGMRAEPSSADWAAVGMSVGISAAGITVVVLAFLDPEPTSKLGLLVGGGAVCVLTGSPDRSRDPHPAAASEHRGEPPRFFDLLAMRERRGGDREGFPCGYGGLHLIYTYSLKTVARA